MSEIFWLDSDSSFIDTMVCDMTSAPSSACCLAAEANAEASLAFSAFLRTVCVIMSIDITVSCKVAAWFWIRSDKSELPEAIWSDASFTVRDDTINSEIARPMFSNDVLMASFITPILPRYWPSTRRVKSPSDCATTTSTASVIPASSWSSDSLILRFRESSSPVNGVVKRLEKFPSAMASSSH